MGYIVLYTEDEFDGATPKTPKKISPCNIRGNNLRRKSSTRQLMFCRNVPVVTMYAIYSRYNDLEPDMPINVACSSVQERN